MIVSFLYGRPHAFGFAKAWQRGQTEAATAKVLAHFSRTQAGDSRQSRYFEMVVLEMTNEMVRTDRLRKYSCHSVRGG